MPAYPALPNATPICSDAPDSHSASSHASYMLPPGKPSAAAIQLWKAAGHGQKDSGLANQLAPDDMQQSDTEPVTAAPISGLPDLDYHALARATKDLTIQQFRESYRDSYRQNPSPQHEQHAAKPTVIDVAVPESPMGMGPPSAASHEDVLKGLPGGFPVAQAPLPTLNPPMAPAASSANGAAPIVNEAELHALLENFCQSLYMGNQSGSNSFGSVVLDVGAILPGAMIEMSRQGASLQVRLYASDKETLLVMQREREKLNASLAASTNLVVKVDAIARG
ncbi:hypothetical protein BCF11_1015 [Collimonas sp. PA-H2]|uniref:hypothetical protein n=1 Tax=Collimonas sp. PA-H2 TaxID=1881062 RepID=UPI000C00F3A6|nr:hypothetical protein [Collimonas sp. PA-H2]PFH08648.1 hypothetical protein BCF11_1015 [Collimonas sp. PA-H2]